MDSMLARLIMQSGHIEWAIAEETRYQALLKARDERERLEREARIPIFERLARIQAIEAEKKRLAFERIKSQWEAQTLEWARLEANKCPECRGYGHRWDFENDYHYINEPCSRCYPELNGVWPEVSK